MAKGCHGKKMPTVRNFSYLNPRRELIVDVVTGFSEVSNYEYLHNDHTSTPRNVMSEGETTHQEAYFLYFLATVGIILNCVVVLFVFIRKRLRKMTTAFLIHACFLDLMKSAYCIPIGSNLLTQQKPPDCNFFGASFVIIVTISAFNMVAMVCAEAYTFGEANIGGNARGTILCVIFGIILVYIGSVILHLGPTLIGGYFDFYPDIGSCSFVLGKTTGYVANVMWIIIITIAMIATIHFIRRLYKEIQVNQPNRVSMLVRSSITIMDTHRSSICNVREMIRYSTHRARIFIMNMLTFVICWYPLFLIIIFDARFKVSPKVYQVFSFIAWSQGAVQPVLYICFDKSLDILAKYMYCDHYRYDIELLAQMLNRHQNPDQAPSQMCSVSDGDHHDPHTVQGAMEIVPQCPITVNQDSAVPSIVLSENDQNEEIESSISAADEQR
ncbi:hypothetical protein ACJMK2_011542 [Sinanodonta woodiana]|uniref:G-protein coupled receptors family 1 profile domain-containing protein n=1 Tax=Sinanodonta woodiana TaxID=1069815 RepID=A0ABD3V8E3_SINWO